MIRDQEAINKHLKTIREALNNDEEYFGSISTLLGGFANGADPPMIEKAKK